MTTKLFFILSTLVIGAASFLAGFIGPIWIEPGANQGPLLGIFITGPLGLVAGAVLGIVLPRILPERFRIKILAAIAATVFVGILVGIACLRGPEFMGRLYLATVTNERPAVDLIPAAIKIWEDRAKQYSQAPKTGWQEDRKNMVQAAGGRIVTLKNVTVWYVYRQRRPWNKGRYTFNPQPSEAERDAFAGPDVAHDSPGWFLAETSGVPADWPPRNVGDFLGVVEIISAPSEIRPLGN